MTVAPYALKASDEANVYSQSGEDGILTAIGQRLYGSAEWRDGRSRACVEIGAWDGVFLSNTANLRDLGWRSCLIEADRDKWEMLQGLKGVVAVNEVVTPANVNELLAAGTIDVMSIDVDGDDIWIWEALDVSQPRIVVIEYNPTYPPFYSRRNPLGTHKGSSLRALEEVGKAKGYDLVYATISNAIFVDADTNAGKLHVLDSFGAFRWDLCRFVVSDFDGQNGLADLYGPVLEAVNPWDGIPSVTLHTYPSEILKFDSAETNALRRLYLNTGRTKI